MCVNQTCVSLFPYIDTSKCPVGDNNVECSGHGVQKQKLEKILSHINYFNFFQSCTNMNKCFCNFGWMSNDCSVEVMR